MPSSYSVSDFAKGVGEGAWDGAKGMVEGVGSLAKGGYDPGHQR